MLGFESVNNKYSADFVKKEIKHTDDVPQKKESSFEKLLDTKISDDKNNVDKSNKLSNNKKNNKIKKVETKKSKIEKNNNVKDIKNAHKHKLNEIDKLVNKVIALLNNNKKLEKVFLKKINKIVKDDNLNLNEKKIKLLKLLESAKKLVSVLQNNDIPIKDILNKKLKKSNNNSLNKIDNSNDDNIKLNKKIKVVNHKKHISAKINNSIDLNKHSDKEEFKLKSNISKNLFRADMKIDKLEQFDNIIKSEKSHSLSKSDINRLIDQIVQKGRITLSEGKSEIMLKLKPDFLGNMLLKLNIDNKGRLDGKIIVNNIMAEKVLKDSLSQLKVSFQDMGLEVGNLDVNLKEGMNFNDSNNKRFDFEYSMEHNHNGINIEDNDLINNGIMMEQVTNYYLTDWLASNVNMTV